jgi:hypothetical protein
MSPINSSQDRRMVLCVLLPRSYNITIYARVEHGWQSITIAAFTHTLNRWPAVEDRIDEPASGYSELRGSGFYKRIRLCTETAPISSIRSRCHQDNVHIFVR